MSNTWEYAADWLAAHHWTTDAHFTYQSPDVPRNPNWPAEFFIEDATDLADAQELLAQGTEPVGACLSGALLYAAHQLNDPEQAKIVFQADQARLAARLRTLIPPSLADQVDPDLNDEDLISTYNDELLEQLPGNPQDNAVGILRELGKLELD